MFIVLILTGRKTPSYLPTVLILMIVSFYSLCGGMAQRCNPFFIFYFYFLFLRGKSYRGVNNSLYGDKKERNERGIKQRESNGLRPGRVPLGGGRVGSRMEGWRERRGAWGGGGGEEKRQVFIGKRRKEERKFWEIPLL